MPFKIQWSEQVENHVRRQAPEPRQAIWRAIKNLAAWDGQENPPHIVHLEDDLAGYSRIRIKGQRIIFREDFEAGNRVIKCLHAGRRSTVYETFRELFLDDLAG